MNTSIDRPWEYSAFPVTVRRTRQLSDSFMRITFHGEKLRDFAPWGLDQRIKLVLPMPDGSAPEFGLLQDPTPHPSHWYARWKELPEDERNVLRTYTPSAVRPALAELDVDVYLHDEPGPAAAWARAATPGEELVITGPDTRAGYTGYGIHFAPYAGVERYVLIGDETALPAIRNILSAVPPDAAADVILDLVDPEDADLIGRPSARTEVRIVSTDRADDQRLLDAVRAWADDPGNADGFGGAYFWIAGESAATTSIRRYLTRDLGVDKDQVAFLGYWRLGGALVG